MNFEALVRFEPPFRDGCCFLVDESATTLRARFTKVLLKMVLKKYLYFHRTIFKITFVMRARSVMGASETNKYQPSMSCGVTRNS